MNLTAISKIVGGIMLALLGYFGQRTMNTLDRIDNNLTTIVVQQSTMQNDIIMLKAAKEENDHKWEERDKYLQDFWKNYDVPVRKTK